jgi:hypothetical protein
MLGVCAREAGGGAQSRCSPGLRATHTHTHSPPGQQQASKPPAACCLDLTQIIDFSMGYVQDRRIGNSGGLGGAFGFLWALGCPFPYPEGKPWTSSWQQQVWGVEPGPDAWLRVSGGRADHTGL